MEFIIAGVLVVAFSSFLVALFRMALEGLWFLARLPFRALRSALRPPPAPEARPSCVVYRFPGRT